MKRILPLLLTVLLSGCFSSPSAPDDALTVYDTDLDIRLSAWTRMVDDRIQFHALVENIGDQTHDIRTLCGHPWQSTLAGPGGEVGYVEVQEPEGCAPYWDKLRPGGHLTFLHSWDFRGHDAATGDSWTVPGGAYTWTLTFGLRDDQTFLTVHTPIDVPCNDQNPCGDTIEVVADAYHDGKQWVLNASAINPGPWTYKVSSICAPVWTDTMAWEGEPVQHREPTAVCEAYGTRDWAPGETLWANMTWDGRLWTCYEGCESFGAYQGDYAWTATVHTLEPSKDFGATVHITV